MRPSRLSKGQFFLVGGELADSDAPAPIWIAIIEGEPLQNRTYNQVAFRIEEADYEICLDRVRALGLSVREDRPRVRGDGSSIFFHDDDNHLFELHSGTLSQRLGRYAQSRLSTDGSS